MSLKAELAREQRAFLGRDRSAWTGHLEQIRGFLGQALLGADPQAPVLVLGAGSGLEVPWALAPAGTVGWDADPWSRVRTLLRHGRWAPWVFEDLTGGMAALSATALRGARQSWSGQARPTAKAALRVAGLLRTLNPEAGPLKAWLAVHRPGTILVANVMGQFGVVAQRAVDLAFGHRQPWVTDPERQDPLEEAVNAWTLRALAAFLGVLRDSGADLWLCHDRGVVFSAGALDLGPLTEPWTAQLRSVLPLEVSDPLCGLDVATAFRGATLDSHRRWLWQLAPGQTHVMEALRVLGVCPCKTRPRDDGTGHGRTRNATKPYGVYGRRA